MKRFSLLLFTCLPFWSFAQNLVPNPHFTQNDYGRVKNWLQPIDDYYHYEVETEYVDSEITYNAVNGICLLQPDKSEFLVVELKHPLEKGKRYCASIRIARGTEFIGKATQVGSIDMAFSDTVIKVLQRRFIYQTPRLQFHCIDENGKIYQPAELQFEADGTERFLMIGKFHNKDAANTLEERKTAIYREQYYTADSIKKYYASVMPKMDPVYPKNKIKRETKRLQDSLEKIEMAQIQALRDNAAFYQQKILDLKSGKDSLFKPYQVRLYLDDVCITPIMENNQCVCEEKEEQAFSVGQTYRLNNIQFDLDKSTFKPESYGEMNNLYAILKQYPKMEIQINGHTDSLNTNAYNLDLSNRRAKAVYDYLIGKGIAAKRLRWKGFGESIPLTENTTEAGRAINRRVEFLILKN